MTTSKSAVIGPFVYAAVAFSLVGGMGATVAAIVNTTPAPQGASVRTKSPLELRVESAREVREALAKPIVQPEPLPPITAKLAKPVTKLAVARPAPRRNDEVAMMQAKQAFVHIDRPQSFFEMLGFGPRN
jgi:hypothetical protein